MATRKKTDKNSLTVITTHVNADYDALASMLAAQKLYADSVVIFPGAQEKNTRNFFVNSMAYLFNMANIKEIDVSRVKRLVLVDTRRENRIGDLSSLLLLPDMELHIYDHHQPMENDLEPDMNVYQPTGATVTILTEIIKEKDIDISPEEATIMCLGIYEDTGSFTFPSTTEKDFEAAAFLLSKGASLNTISNLIAREINPQQIGILNDMIQAAHVYKINGVDIAVTVVSTDNYVSDFAFLVHKMLKMENYNAIFVIARMGDSIYIVARSRIPDVDAGAILTQLGGGGHAFAASATIKDRTLAQTEQQLFEILDRKISSRRQAKDLMSSPAIAVEPGISCGEANGLLTRYNINALLVKETAGKKDRLLGIISRQVIEKAIHHSLDKAPVKDYMTTEFVSVAPDAELAEIQEKIIENKQRILPVIDDDVITGVITRTDLLNILVHQSVISDEKMPDLNAVDVSARSRNVIKFMRERLPDRMMDMLKEVGRVAHEAGYSAFVVGGFVRDLFLYKSNEDIDVVIEGDGIAFARMYAEKSGARIHAHEKFGTAVIIFPDGFKIDVASARMEYYKFPAALPTVEMSSIKLDLFRRDFTINTLAIHLDPERFGTLIDFFSALRDIKDKVIRILHNLSFVEDPTRVFRAIRFEQRFGFSIGKLTTGLIENAVKMDFFDRISGRRVFAELRQILEEENPVPAIVRLSDFDLLKVIHPSIQVEKKFIHLLNSVRDVLSWYDLLFLEESYMKWAVYFLAITSQCDRTTTEEICRRFELAPRHQKLFVKERFEAEDTLFSLERKLPLTNSSLYNRLSVFKTELLLYMMASAIQEKVKKSISNYVTRLRHIDISLRGQDILEMGIKPGPVFREVMQAVLDARLDGRIKTRKDELDFARNHVS